uniref:Transmembrane protein 236 n=1 Tax=Vombatus ursinus TaxID=29139 RepID=A0A4X2M7W3_VOMUR
MVSGKLIKSLVYEILEVAAFSIPTLVMAEQFASVFQRTENSAEKTFYWLVVVVSIVYVALVTLIVWIPVKILLYKKHHLCSNIKQWRPPLMMCVVLTTLPCFGFSIAVTENASNISALPDTLPDLPVSVVLASLIIVDIIEKLRKYPLRGKPISNIHKTNLQQVKTVTEQEKPSEENHTVPQPANRSSFGSGTLRAMSQQDKRAEIFLSSFITWSDTIEMLRVSGHSVVFKSGWLYPVYIFTYISLLRIIVAPQNSLVGSLGVFLQDFPFMVVRISLIADLGTITPIIGLLKNILVTLSYFYFNYLTAFTTNETTSF